MKDVPNELYAQIYSKLAYTLSVPGVVGKNPSSILSIHFPGQYVSTDLNVDNPKDQYVVANALDAVISASWIVEYKSSTVSGVYKSILDGKELPNISISTRQKSDLERAQKELQSDSGNPSMQYNEYIKYQHDYISALDDYENALTSYENGGAAITEKIKNNLDLALNNWVVLGHRDIIEEALAIVQKLEPLEPAVFWQDLKIQYDSSTRNFDKSSSFQYTTSNPPYDEWFKPCGWTRFNFDNKDYANQRPAGSTGFNGTQCCCEQSALEIPPSYQVDMLSNFKLKGELKRVDIIRPWLNEVVFNSRAWRWSRASVSYGSIVSSGGNIAGRTFPNGRMPVLPKTAILARNLVIEFEQSVPQHVVQKIDDKSSFHLGPFLLDKAIIDESSDNRIFIDEAQLIGFVSTMLPQSPNPDTSLDWPSNVNRLTQEA